MGAIRKTRAVPRWQQRMAAASGNPSAELELAYDRLRSAAARMSRARRDPVRQAEAATLAASVLREAAGDLTGHAARLEQSENRRGDAR